MREVIEPVELRGQWWLPGQPERAQGGILRYDQVAGARLDLAGAFGPAAGVGFEGIPIILGGARTGESITLVRCLPLERSGMFAYPRPFPGLESESWSADWVLIGDHFEDEPALSFAGADFGLSYLEDWVSRTGLNDPIDRYVTGDPEVRFKITWRQPDSYLAELEELSVAIHFGHSSSGSHSRSPSFREHVRISVRVQQAVALPDVLRHLVMPWRDLVALGTGRPNAVEELSLTGRGGDVNPLAPVVLARFKPTRVIERDEGPLRLREMLCSFDQLEESISFTELARRWVDVQRDLELVCGPFFAVIHTPDMYIDDQFLLAARALEVYHRLRFANERYPADEWAARLGRLTSGLTDDDRGWLLKELQYANQPRLRKRLRDLREMLPSSLRTLLSASAIDEIVNQRNDLAHLNRVARTGADVRRLWSAFARSMLVLEYLLLAELGVSFDAAANMVHDGPRMEMFRSAVNVT